MADTVVNTEAIQGALKAVKIIRSSVRDLFKLLSEGTDVASVAPQTENGTAVAVPANDAREKQFLNDLQSIVGNLNTRIRELESSCTLLAHPNLPLTLGNSALLGQDPAFERSLIYSSMVTSYRWCDKMLEYASHANAMLSQNSLRRSNFNSLTNSSIAMGRSRYGVPIVFPRRSIGHNMSAQAVDNICHMMQRPFPDLNIELVRPFGTATVMKITLERVLKAVILLRGLIIEWIMVKGYHEDFEGDGKTSIDIWSESRYEVFRKVTNHANAAMLHFYSPLHPDLAVTSYLKWLHSYSTLFSKPCRKCECRLQDSLPPTWRELRSGDAYHELCRPN